MIKSLKGIQKQEQDSFNIPKKIQDIIPIQKIWEDGIFQIGKNKYSIVYKFSDINYMVASREDKEKMFLGYSELLNSFDSGATTKITVVLRHPNQKNLKEEILIPFQEDGLDIYRNEYNQMILNKALGTSGMLREMYLTVSVFKNNYEEAKSYFNRTTTEFTIHLSKLGSKCTTLDTAERLRILYDFYRPGEEACYNFSFSNCLKNGINFKDYICPDSFHFEKDYFMMGKRYGRAFFLKDYASYIRDSIISELTDINQNMMLSIDVIPVQTDEAVKEVENRLLGVETNITNWQRKQNANNNFSAVIPYDLEQQRKESKEFLDDLTTRDQRMMFANLTLVITADTKEELETESESILTVARKHLCQLSILNYQQMDGLNTTLPLGVRKIKALRTLTTEGVSVLHPFKVQEIMDRNGIYYGVNAISHNLIMVNKENLLNQSAFLLGVPGSGKSFCVKQLITFLALSTNDHIIICDPENEYTPLVEALGGEVIHISPGSNDRINAMDMVEGYSCDGNPIADKSEFILSLFEQLDKKLGSVEKSIIDRCVTLVYTEAEEHKRIPTLSDLRTKLLEQPEKEAHNLALSLELFTNGSLNIFSQTTNVNTRNRIISFDIMNLGKQLKKLGMLVIIDSMINRVTENFYKGIRTHLFLDEIKELLDSEFSTEFFESAWRRYRKRGGYPTGATQNVGPVLESTSASTLISNSELIIMLNQASQDRQKLASLLKISDEQLSYITNSEAGCGLIKYGGSLVPFINEFPTNTRLYSLMTTKPSDRKN